MKKKIFATGLLFCAVCVAGCGTPEATMIQSTEDSIRQTKETQALREAERQQPDYPTGGPPKR
ncbi:hypothetical protein SAMN06265222_116106 [Neorhodopirellula lusitana]|uniref:Secreted protein n=1 Tax=Neorhodopirellula lusitana TaxID=445327 RepID=A0ABY1QM23_9BACT|nr:hypothetical protein [Neorhodopirellula lusitana]SMP73373.1 hypothetical protein SAMN06265222_116106 [Neorhodopirellula lusitana]